MKKHILITGSTDGIGKLAALKLAQEGHHVYFHGRNPQKLEAIVAEAKSLSNHDQIGGYLADFSDMAAVKAMAEQVLQELPKLDVLINNAGVFKSSLMHNQEGLDMRFVVNYFAPYLLTRELLPLLQKGKEPRLINLSSAAQAPVSYQALNGHAQVSTQSAYAQSKLALTMWSFYLAKQLPQVSVIAVNPGSLLDTNMVRESYGYHWSPAEKGSDILYDLAVSDTYAGLTGKYWDNDKGSFGEAHPDAYKIAELEKLIQATELKLKG